MTGDNDYYPPQLAGWQRCDNFSDRTYGTQQESPPAHTGHLAAVEETIRGRVTQWWGVMTQLQLRGFILIITLLTSLSLGSVLVQYWLYRPQSAEMMQPAHSSARSADAQLSPLPVTTSDPAPLAQNPASSPKLVPLSPSSPGVTAPPSSSGGSALLNINTASQSDLETLPGVGPSTARAILQFRQKNGAFHSVDELTAVEGIGTKKLEKLRPYVTVR